MNYRQVETFDAVMKVQSISRAAEILDISQPVVSRTIAELESDLGFTLFERIRNRIIPTPEAQLLHQDVNSFFRGMDSLRQSAARIRDRGTGHIWLASVVLLATSVVPRALKLFQERQPAAIVNLAVQSSRDIRNGIISGTFEIGLTLADVDTSGVNHQPFTASRAYCVMPVGHPLAAFDSIVPQHLDGVAFISYKSDDRDQQTVDALFREWNIRPRTVVETDDAVTLCNLVAEGVGIGFVCPYALAGVDQSKLAARPIEPSFPRRSLMLLPVERPKSLLVRDMIECLMMAR